MAQVRSGPRRIPGTRALDRRGYPPLEYAEELLTNPARAAMQATAGAAHIRVGIVAFGHPFAVPPLPAGMRHGRVILPPGGTVPSGSGVPLGQGGFRLMPIERAGPLRNGTSSRVVLPPVLATASRLPRRRDASVLGWAAGSARACHE